MVMQKKTSLILMVMLSLFLFGQCKNEQAKPIKNKEEKHKQELEKYKEAAKNNYKKNEFEKSIEHQFKRLEIAQFINDTLSIAQTYHKIASGYAAWDKFNLGIKYYYKAYETYKLLGDSLWMAHELNDIGYANLYHKNYEKVIEFYKKALTTYKRLDIREEVALAEANIGFAFNFWGKPDSAIYHHNIALEIYLELKDSSNYPKMYHGLGDAERRRGNLPAALSHLKNAYYFSLKHQDLFNQAGHRLRIGQVYTHMGLHELAEQTFNECLPGLQQRNSGKWWKNYYEALYSLYEKKGDFKKAFFALRNFKSIEDSLFNAKLKNEINEMHILHETKEKEQEIELLEAKNELAIAEISFQKRIVLASIIVIIIFGVLIGLIYKQYLSKKRAYVKLFEKNKAIIEYENSNQKDINQEEEDTDKSTQNQIKQDEFIRIKSKLEVLIKEKKIFLRNDINLGYLCKKLNTNSAYLSQIINQVYGKNFNSMINEHRIKEVQKFLINGEHKTLTIEGIALKSGFKNRVTFNTAFKKITGITPSFYINSLSTNS